MNDNQKPGVGGESDAAGKGEGSFRVPSFDELMGFGAPQSGSDDTSDSVTAAEPADGQVENVETGSEDYRSIFSAPDQQTSSGQQADSRASEQQVSSASNWMDQGWANGSANSAAGAADDDQLTPLILPGFSPEPQHKDPLPPLFQADASADGASDYDNLPPTQPVPTIDSTPTAEPDTDTDPFASLGLDVSDSEEVEQFDEVRSETAQKPEQERPAPVPAVPIIPAAPPVQAAPPVSAASVRPPAQKPAQTAPLPAAAAASAARSQSSGPQSARRNDAYEKISVTGGDGPRRRVLPWVIVIAGVLVALIASILVINSLSNQADPDPTPEPVPTTSEPAPQPEPSPTEEPTPTPTTPASDEVPEVEVGPTFAIPITQWGIDVEKPQRLGSLSYSGLTDEGLTLEIELAQSLPESCAAARNGWGLSKQADGTLEVVRPMPRCTEPDAAAVYDTIWGLVDHMAKSAKPSS